MYCSWLVGNTSVMYVVGACGAGRQAAQLSAAVVVVGVAVVVGVLVEVVSGMSVNGTQIDRGRLRLPLGLWEKPSEQDVCITLFPAVDGH